MPAGRPTKYTEDMPDTVVEEMRQGKSKRETAAALGIHYDTFNEWSKDPNKPEFSDAIKLGENLSQAWWEEQMREAAVNGTGNATLYIFNMKNRFTRDWTDRKEIDHGLTDEAINILTKVKSMTDEELERFVGAED